MLTAWDYLNIAFYFAFIIGVGLYFIRRSKNTSDYFRGGGIMPWWMAGASSWMAGFSAWTFTGAAGKMYSNGFYVLGLYYAGIVPLFVLLIFTCYRFRRMRVVTPLEGVRLRFGAPSQQFFTWIRLPFMLIFGGFGLNAVGVFMAAVFDMPITPVLIGLGVIVTFVSLLGGSFGVAASDFVQMFLVVTVTVIVAVLALGLPGVDGVSGLMRQIPKAHYDFSGMARPEFIFLWFMALMVNNLFGQNSMDGSSKFLMTRSDRHARLMLSIPIVGSLLGPLLWVIPPMVAAIRHPELGSMFPKLAHPEEAAFLATALDVLPQGMLGLLVCSIFAATLTTMDAGLNQGAGIFVRNFYLPIINPHCHEKKLLIISKFATGIFGAVIIVVGIIVDRYHTLGLFDLLNQVGVSLSLPLVIPLAIGMFYKRTPSWSTWSTALIGLACAFWVKFVLTPEMVSWIPGLRGPFMPEEVTQFYLFATVAVVVVVCVLWFFFTSFFYERSSAAYKADVEEFFRRLREPLDTRAGEETREDHAISVSVGKLCLIYGSFVALLLFIPNSFTGRMCFLGSGGVMIISGLFLMWRYRHRIKPPELNPGERMPDNAV